MSSGSSSSAPGGAGDNPNALGKAFRNIDLDGHDLPPSPAPSSPRNGRRYALATELVYTESNDQYNASSVPIYQVREYLRLVRWCTLAKNNLLETVRYVQGRSRSGV